LSLDGALNCLRTSASAAAGCEHGAYRPLPLDELALGNRHLFVAAALAGGKHVQVRVTVYSVPVLWRFGNPRIRECVQVLWGTALM
jgi:hypothetical protein